MDRNNFFLSVLSRRAGMVIFLPKPVNGYHSTSTNLWGEPMQDRQKHGIPILTILALLLLVAFVGVLGTAFMTLTVSGSATLPNGATVDIAGACSMSETPESTLVEFAGRNFEFTKTTIVVDGVEVGKIEDSTKRLALRVDRVPFLRFFSRANGVVLTANGKTIALPY